MKDRKLAVRSAAPDASHALTSVRFFAALYVLLFHAAPVLVPTSSIPTVVLHTISFGYVSVSFFFLLSGYILSIAYLGANARKLEPLNRFYIARFARVYPLYILTLFVDLPDWFVAHAKSFTGYAGAVLPACGVLLQHLVMLQAWTPHIRGIDRPNWSLSVEAFLYLLFPFVAIRIWRLQSKSIVMLGLALWVGGLGLVHLFAGHISLDAIMFLPAFHLSTFFLGIALARWQILNQERLESSMAAFFLLLVALVLGALFFRHAESIDRAYLNDGMLAPLFAALILAVSINTQLPARLLSHPLLRRLGDASYALYLFHFPILHYFQRLHVSRTWATFAIYVIACLATSLLSFRYFETPLRLRLASRIREPQQLRSEPM